MEADAGEAQVADGHVPAARDDDRAGREVLGMIGRLLRRLACLARGHMWSSARLVVDERGARLVPVPGARCARCGAEWKGDAR
jgi:hypothetical protein